MDYKIIFMEGYYVSNLFDIKEFNGITITKTFYSYLLIHVSKFIIIYIYKMGNKSKVILVLIQY